MDVYTDILKVTSENKEVYLCGDFNIDLLKVDEINIVMKNIVIISKKHGIRSIVNIKNSMNPKIGQLNIKGTVIDDPKPIVNEINHFFS